MATTQVTPGQRAAVGAYGEIVITRGTPRRETEDR
jgi:hypothetical protein